MLDNDRSPELYAAGIPLPSRLVHAIQYLRGAEAGLEWLLALDGVLEECGDHWGLQYDGIAEGGAMSCCAFCRDEQGRDLVLKVPVDPESGRAETTALRHWSRFGVAPRVIDSRHDSGVFLMERVRPGDTYTGVADPAEASAFLTMLGCLDVAAADEDAPDAPPLSRLLTERLSWARRRFQEPEFSHLTPDLDRAQQVMHTLSQSGASQLVHGDLQAKNILVGPRGALICIDPIASYGDPLSDAAMWAVLQDSDVPIASLLDQVSIELEIDESRLKDWAYVIASVELRPLQPHRFARQSEFLSAFDDQ